MNFKRLRWVISSAGALYGRFWQRKADIRKISDVG
jgi:hypothetical protein